MVRWLIGLLIVCLCGCNTAWAQDEDVVVDDLIVSNQITLSGTMDGVYVAGNVLWWPEEDSGVGLAILGGDAIPGNKFAFGPCVEFSLEGLSDALFKTILPDAWELPWDVPATPFGKLELLFETENWDMLFTGATGFHLFPDREIKPCVWMEYIVPEGSTKDWLEEDLRYMVGFMINIK